MPKMVNSKTDLDPVAQSLVVLSQLSVGTGQVLAVDLQLADFAVVLLLESAHLGLVPHLDLGDGALELLDGTGTALAVDNKKG